VPFNRDNSGWWEEMVDELMFSRVPFTLMHGRGCYDLTNTADDAGNGNMCPHVLSQLVAAVNRAGDANVAKFGMFIDTGAMPGFRSHFTGKSGLFDLTPVPGTCRRGTSGTPTSRYFLTLFQRICGICSTTTVKWSP
jgi:hypothetical protein